MGMPHGYQYVMGHMFPLWGQVWNIYIYIYIWVRFSGNVQLGLRAPKSIILEKHKTNQISLKYGYLALFSTQLYWLTPSGSVFTSDPRSHVYGGEHPTWKQTPKTLLTSFAILKVSCLVQLILWQGVICSLKFVKKKNVTWNKCDHELGPKSCPPATKSVFVQKHVYLYSSTIKNAHMQFKFIENTHYNVSFQIIFTFGGE